MKIGDAPTVWVPHSRLEKYLKSIDWKKYAVLCHNTAFDGFILSHLFDIVPAFYLDTLSMSRAVFGAHVKHGLNDVAARLGLGAKIKEALESTKGVANLSPKVEAELGGYCIQDVELTHKAFWAMYDYMPDDELELIDMTIRMFCDPVLEIDSARVQRELEKEVGGKVAAMMRSGVAASDLVSNKKFAALLEAAGVKPPMKISPATGKPTYAFAKTDLGFQALGECGNPKVEALYEARLKIKSSIGETRAIRFLEAGKDGMKLPVLLNYCGAHTTRWSGGNKINLQNLVRGGELRKSIVAPPGHVIVVADSAQIEARMVAWLAGQDDLVQAFREKRDIYSEFGTSLFNRPIDRKRTEINSLGETIYPDFIAGHTSKVCVLGLGFGLGAVKLQSTLEQGAMGVKVILDRKTCELAVRLYRQRYSNIAGLWAKLDAIMIDMAEGNEVTLGPLKFMKNCIQLPSGLFMQYPDLDGTIVETWAGPKLADASYRSRYGKNKIYGGLLTENVVQALARCAVAEQMLTVSRAGYRVVTMTHDEIVCVVPEPQAQECLDFMLKTMSTAPDWAPGLPLFAEGGFDTIYSK